MNRAQAAAIKKSRGMWLEQTSAAVDDVCGNCNADVVWFRIVRRGDQPVVLEGHDVPITTDLLEVQSDGLPLLDHTWTYHGPDQGWVHTSSRRRTWRRVRAEHTCAVAPENKHKEKS